MPRAWTIAGRLTLHYASATLVILLLGGGSLYWVLERELREQDRALVLSKLRVLREITASYPAGAEALASEIVHEAGEEGPLHFLLRVRDEHGTSLVETPGMDTLVPAPSFPRPTSTDAKAAGVTPLDECATCASSASARYLLATAYHLTRGESRQRLELQVALEVSATAHVLEQYRRKLAAVILLGLAAAVAIGYAIPRVAMRPVRDISRLASGISANRLAAGLVGEHSWPEELRELAASFDGMLVRLNDAFTRLSEFSEDLAHALRNPINNLRGEAEVALARARSVEEYEQVLGSSLEEFARLSRLIDSLLFLARAENPHQAIEQTRFSVRRELDTVREFYDALASERQISVECEGSASLAGDPVLVRRAISNLLANALNHTADGGRVLMSAVQQSDGRVIVSVHDTGHGIAADDLPRVFDRFYRVETGQVRDSRGAGLGLAIVKSIMRLHRGVASIESTVNAGTTIRLEFPANAPIPGDPAA